jgi:hypothetical protein
MGFLFFEEQELTLAEIKQHVAGWDHYRLVKAAVDMWPELPHPDLWTNVRREIVEIATGRDKLFQRAADRLAETLHPGSPHRAEPLKQVAEVEEREPTYNEIEQMDFDGLIAFVFSRKSLTLDATPTFKAVVEAMPARPAANTLECVSNELRALGVTERSSYNYALQRLSRLIYAGLNPPWEETKSL